MENKQENVLEKTTKTLYINYDLENGNNSGAI